MYCGGAVSAMTMMMMLLLLLPMFFKTLTKIIVRTADHLLWQVSGSMRHGPALFFE
jgi:hypothetical protein